MNIESLFLGSLFLLGTTLLARVAVRRLEQARFTTAAEYSLKNIRAGKNCWRRTSID